MKYLFSNRSFLKLHKIHVKRSFLESLFKNIADPGTGIYLWIFHNFSKNLVYRTPPDNCSCWFLCSNHWSHFIHFFLRFFPFIIDNWIKVSKNEEFFTFYNSFLLITQMLLKQFCLSNNLLTHIKYRFHSAKASAIAEWRGKLRLI